MPMRSPAMILGRLAGSAALQMTMRQPAAVAMRAAVSLVAMPPVPHCVPLVLVSTCASGGERRKELGCGRWDQDCKQL